MIRRWTAPWLALLVSACTGSAPPTDAEPRAHDRPPSAPPAAAPVSAPAKPVADATTEVLQLALDVKEMDGFWHTDVRPDRVPLKVAPHTDLPSSIALVKFGEPVVIEKDAPLHFETITVSASEARVGYRYDPEGVIVEVRLQSDGTKWRVVDTSVAER